jgi:CheY-like chemotaxis protein
MLQKDGRQALLEIKADPLLRSIPIVIFTTSEEKKDISFTMSAGAELFMTTIGVRLYPAFQVILVDLITSQHGGLVGGVNLIG